MQRRELRGEKLEKDFNDVDGIGSMCDGWRKIHRLTEVVQKLR
jgi:hypothetical protein